MGSKSNWYDLGLGTLFIFIQDLNTPVLSVPLHIPGTLDLDNGRAWMVLPLQLGKKRTSRMTSFRFPSLHFEWIEMIIPW